MTPALAIILGVILAAAAVGLIAGRKVKMNLENWTVGGRNFGVVIIWLLMAGEVYTTFTFLGASGWAYSKGAPTYYILIYGTLAYTLSFFILPEIWKIGKREGLHTQPDFFAHVFQSRWLGVLVAVIGILSLLPYLQLQLAGLGMIVEVASAGAVSSTAGILLAFLLTSAFVLTSGLHGSAWVSVIKDVLMLAAVGIVGFGIPHIHFGGIGKMFEALIAQAPNHLVFPGSAPTMGVPWVMSTVLLTGMGFYMWPQLFGTAFAAKSDRIIRRNAIIMPLYQIPIVLIFFVGFSAFLLLPGLTNGDLSLLTLVAKTYPSWFVGFVGAAGAVTAMVPASVLVLTAAALLAKNVYRAGFRPAASDQQVMRVSRVMVLLVSSAALVFALLLPNALVNLLLIGYDGVAQLFPGVVCGLFWKRVTRTGVAAGLVTGLAGAAFLVFGKHDPLFGLNAGFVALIVNAVVTVAVSLATRPETRPACCFPGRFLLHYPFPFGRKKMLDDIKNEAEALSVRLSGWRRAFHRHPEIAFNEFKTAATLKSFFEALGIPVQTLAGTGLRADLSGRPGGRTVALRADIDALPLQEEGEKPCLSENPGACHACGHDGHMAALMGAAEILARRKESFRGRVVFLCQPAEELPPGGALPMIEEGALDGVDAIFGLHLWQSLPTGKVGLLAGPLMAQADNFRITVTGRGGHGSMPQATADPILAAGHLIVALQSIVSRNVDPLKPAVLSFGTVSGGTVYNIIPNEVRLSGTVRTFEPEVQALMKKRLAEIVEATGQAGGVRAVLEYEDGYPPLINPPDSVEFARRTVESLWGAEAIVPFRPVMGGEDFARYLQKIPGAFIFLGSGDGKPHPHHHPEFDLDERALVPATALLSALALSFLEETR